DSDSDSDVAAVAVDVATVDAAEVDSTEVATDEKESVAVVETEVESVVAALVSELSSGSEVGEFDVGDSSVAPAEVSPAEEVEEAVQVLVDNVAIEAATTAEVEEEVEWVMEDVVAVVACLEMSASSAPRHRRRSCSPNELESRSDDSYRAHKARKEANPEFVSLQAWMTKWSSF
ncbi:hypothetical protein BBJ28_00025733, partial [Nothophytophthora sp. Chile5]